MSNDETLTPRFFDANVLISFAVVDRLDLLRGMFGRTVRWPEAVALEVSRHAGIEPRAERIRADGLLGDPVTIPGIAETLAVEDLRFRLTGRPTATKNLGEAQCIYLAQRDGGTVVTDDRGAADFARRLGVEVLESVDVLNACYQEGLTGCPESFDLLHEMRGQGRGVRVPPSHHHVC